MKFGKQMCVLNVSHVTCLHMKLYLEVSQGAATTTGIGKVVGWGHWNTRTYKKLSWCWQTHATPLEVSQGHQTVFSMLGMVSY